MNLRVVPSNTLSPEFPCHATIDGEVDAAVEDEQDLGDTAGDHCPERDLEAVLLPSFQVILQSYELVDVEDDSGNEYREKQDTLCPTCSPCKRVKCTTCISIAHAQMFRSLPYPGP